MLRDDGGQIFGPLLPYYLRGELGFEMGRVSTRKGEKKGCKLMGWGTVVYLEKAGGSIGSWPIRVGRRR